MRSAFMAGSVLLFGAVAAGCASGPALRTEPTKSAIRAAEEVGAPQVPRASVHLQLAKDELERATGLAASGEKERAASLLLRAEADADLAIALSHEQAEKSEAAHALERVRALRQANQ